MAYKVFITPVAEEELDRFISYLINEKMSARAAGNVLNDFEETVRCLTIVAGSLKLCEQPKLKKLGYRRMNFLAHDYFMLYRIEEDTVIVDAIFHALQDYENKLK
ncbi:MAG: type II toxin-antitoxin system RelE/ParE family toxin [Clostridiales bacterium]|nr:type II toxin-antitoxin system RelE/ParE family toxin [Clostridiales bacterium]